jgi:LmbE family N-acetylglucosaminyl deacetylase
MNVLWIPGEKPVTHPFHPFVNEFARLLEEGRSLPLGDLEPAPAPRLQDNAPRVLIFAPHPDDECVIGALPLRLRREQHFRVSAVAVTQGSRPDRQAERLEEMREACHFLGFEMITTQPNGLTSINLRTREHNPEAWKEAVETIAHIIAYHRASVIVLPHANDFHSTHTGTHHLVLDALATLGPGLRCKIVETEFWHAMEDPNLMVESSPEDVADLVAALSIHKSQVTRNPYHLFLPAWMADNVRRGSEVVGGQGAGDAQMRFATLYRVREWVKGGFAPVLGAGQIVPVGQGLAAIFK